jgi:hypothetical protein
VKLIGRRNECARIDRLLADVRNGLGGVLVLRGEPGPALPGKAPSPRSRARVAPEGFQDHVARRLGGIVDQASAPGNVNRFVCSAFDRSGS